MSPKYAIKVRVQLQVIRIEIMKEFFGTQHFGNLDELVVIVMSVEEWLLSKDHTGKHATQTPHV
jgi:hypothetical protein